MEKKGAKSRSSERERIMLEEKPAQFERLTVEFNAIYNELLSNIRDRKTKTAQKKFIKLYSIYRKISSEDLSREELKILEQQESELAGEVIETIEEAAEYTGVDEQTVKEWVDNGMLLTEEGYYIMSQLDLYLETDGNPTIDDKMRLNPSKVVPADARSESGEPREPGAPPSEDKPFQQSPPGGDSIGGYSPEELEQMPIDQLIDIFFRDK